MESGIEQITQERAEQITKHGRSILDDVKYNSRGQLMEAMVKLTLNSELHEVTMAHPPSGWNEEIWRKMCMKPYKQRLIIAGALLAAEIDRLNNK